MKNNYPIKYAAMPIIEQVGWSHGLNELERKYDVVCYIVSKCYLLSNKIKYKANGTSEKEYEVVFPYQIGRYYTWERTNPSFNYINSSCTNSYLVSEIFDTYEEALEYATEKNDKLCKDTWVYLPYSEDLEEQIAKKIEEFNERLAKYKLIEQEIISNTTDLDQSNVRKLDNLLMNYEGKTKMLYSNLYENLSSYYDFIVYSISQEEYDEYVSYNEEESEVKKFKSAVPILYHAKDDGNIMVINPDGEIKHYINKWGHLVDNDKDTTIPYEFKDKTQVLFTTEKLEDIITSFNIYKNIDPDKVVVKKKTS